MHRIQFPINIAYGLTINKVQGQTCNKVGLYLPRPVFAHGQLYVALSRAGLRRNTKVLVVDTNYQGRFAGLDGVYTKNIVWKAVFKYPIHKSF